MSGSTWNGYLGGQADARNRWTSKNAVVRSADGNTALSRPGSARSALIAAAIVAGMLALFVVLIVSRTTPSGTSPAMIPAGNSVTVVSGHGGGGTAPRAL